jgi:hypothetical protein
MAGRSSSRGTDVAIRSERNLVAYYALIRKSFDPVTECPHCAVVRRSDLRREWRESLPRRAGRRAAVAGCDVKANNSAV